MDDAFNRDHSKEPPQVRDAWVMGAAQWIMWRAEEAFSLVQKPGDPEIRKVRKQFSFLQSRKRDDAVEKKWPYTWNQWHAWKDGFRTVAGSEAYSSTCRTIAEEAADLMGGREVWRIIRQIAPSRTQLELKAGCARSVEKVSGTLFRNCIT
jgi:hypothetical protein